MGFINFTIALISLQIKKNILKFKKTGLKGGLKGFFSTLM